MKAIREQKRLNEGNSTVKGFRRKGFWKKGFCVVQMVVCDSSWRKKINVIGVPGFVCVK
jgi:hypothetical protein